MKKTVLACAGIMIFTFHLAPSTSLRAQGFDWGRISLSADFSSQGNTFGIANGLRLTGHPERAVHLTAAYRLGRRWELGIYGGYKGSDAPTASVQSFANNPLIRSVYVENTSDFIYGALVQWYLVPYDKRQYIFADVALRVGFDFSGTEADNVWGGMSAIYRATDHVALCLDVDFGSFRYASISNFVNERDTWGTRSTLRLQVAL